MATHEGAFSCVEPSTVVPGYVVRRDKAVGHITAAWRVLFLCRLAGLVENDYVELPRYNTNMIGGGVMKQCTQALDKALALCTSYEETVALLNEMLPTVCAGLHVMHRSGLVHGDIKASNIMCAPDGVWKIIDFDTARPFPTGKQINCPARTPPEALKDANMYCLGSDIDRHTHCAADIWALGCVIKTALQQYTLDPEMQRTLDMLCHPDVKKRHLPPLTVAVKPAPVHRIRWFNRFWSHDEIPTVRQKFIDDIARLGALQPKCRWSLALFAVAIQLLDRFHNDAPWRLETPERAARTVQVCVHAATMICNEDVPPVITCDPDNEYCDLLASALRRIPTLCINLQNSDLHNPFVVDKLRSAPLSLPAYVALH